MNTTDIIQRAQDLAKEVLEDETYKHTARIVSGLLIDGYTSGHLIAAAWLHDVVEDTHITNRDIRMQFGDVVSSLIELLTHQKDCESYDLYILRVASDQMARVIKVHDIVDNLTRGHDKLSKARWATLKSRYRRALVCLTSQKVAKTA